MPFNYFERFIAFRYLVPLRKGGLLSVISWLSFIGICIGVATLIIVMSVMNGFHDELKKRIIGFNGHIYIKNIEPYFENDKNLSEIKINEYQKFQKVIDKNIYKYVDVDKSLSRKKTSMSTNPKEVSRMIKKYLKFLKV